MAGIGVTELLIVLGIVLLIFGPKRLPMLGRQLGGGMREFRDSITKRHEAAEHDEEPHAELPAPAEPRDA
jgi:sec-independent protein translocase protein TatA